MNLEGKRVWVTGRGMVGKALIRQLKELNIEVISKGKKDLDLREQSSVRKFLIDFKPDIIYQTAAKVGGILANSSYPADFIFDNLAIQTNIINEANKADINNLVMLGSSCVYPKDSLQPIKEEYLLSGPLEPTNQWYAVAKIAGAKMIEAYRKQYDRNYFTVFPTNLYGMHDNFDLNTSHVLPALMKKIHFAKKKGDDFFVVWGSGKALREFLFVDDLADALIFLTKNYKSLDNINIGSDDEVSIDNLCSILKSVIGYEGKIKYDTKKPEGTMRKKTDTHKLYSMGWKPKVSLEVGLKKTYKWFLENQT